MLMNLNHHVTQSFPTLNLTQSRDNDVNILQFSKTLGYVRCTFLNADVLKIMFNAHGSCGRVKFRERLWLCQIPTQGFSWFGLFSGLCRLVQNVLDWHLAPFCSRMASIASPLFSLSRGPISQVNWKHLYGRPEPLSIEVPYQKI